MACLHDITPGTILKLPTGGGGIYFQVTRLERTACELLQICQLQEKTLHFKYKVDIRSHVYHSEIGTSYQLVNEAELNHLSQLIQTKMLEDFQLLVEVYRRKLAMLPPSDPLSNHSTDTIAPL